jgi:hypothetical protein
VQARDAGFIDVEALADQLPEHGLGVPDRFLRAEALRLLHRAQGALGVSTTRVSVRSRSCFSPQRPRLGVVKPEPVGEAARGLSSTSATASISLLTPERTRRSGCGSTRRA